MGNGMWEIVFMHVYISSINDYGGCDCIDREVKGSIDHRAVYLIEREMVQTEPMQGQKALVHYRSMIYDRSYQADRDAYFCLWGAT